MSKFILIYFVLFSVYAHGQLYQGPESGSVPNGVIMNTGTVMDYIIGEKLSPYVRKPLRNKIPFQYYSDNFNRTPASAPEGSNYFTDPSIKPKDINYNPIEPILVKSFQGFTDPGSYIPPDQYIAAGPTHLIGVDNSRFRIYDKNGVVVKTIYADTWFASALPGVGAFDPKILYDHFSKRWIMVWLDQSDDPQRGYYLLSVSDDSIPMGTWYNWALPSDKNGSTPCYSWGDYQGVGFDNQAIYLTSNQFAFGGNFQGTKIRIIAKSQLYNNTAGPVVYTDLWDLREPQNFGIRTFGARPTVFYSTASEYYFVVTSPYNTGTFFSVYKLVNPLTNPVMTGVNISVTAYSSPPNANQLGGGSPLIETGGSSFKFEPVYSNGYIWGVHNIRSGTGNAYSSVRYFKLNMNNNTAVEDGAMGADGYWFFYPSLTIDKDQNVAITYSRSGTNEYIGAYYTTRLSTDPPNTLSGSKTLQTGKSNYVKTFGGGRNRWGDYNGIWIDPADRNNFWIFTQYAETLANTWGVWTGLVRLIPFSGAKIETDKDTINFGIREVSFSSDTLNFIIRNFGQDTLVISNIQIQNSQFHILTNITYPFKLGFNQSKLININYVPSVAGNVYDSLKIISNDVLNPSKAIYLKAKGYVINPANAGVIYGVTGMQANGAFVYLNKYTGQGTLIGLTGYSYISGISVRPSDKKIFGCISGAAYSTIVRINTSAGDAYTYKDISLKNVRSVAFDTNDDFYCVTDNSNLYKYNLNTGDTVLIGNTGISNLNGIAINPLNGQMWGISLANKIFKINKYTGTATQVGIPGFTFTPSIAFNHLGKLYGTSGLGSLVSTLISYDTSTGTATLIGSTGYQGINSIAISQEPVVVENISSGIPSSFQLYQNYPNPFNPSTTITFDIPVASKVTLNIYDALGREVTKLINENLDAGSYRYVLNNNILLSSGLYFYKLSASGINTNISSYVSVKKMLYVK